MMAKFKLHANDPLAEDAMNILENSGLFEISAEHYDNDELKKKLDGVDFLVVRSATKVKRDVIEAGKDLKVIGRAGIGLDNVDLEAAKENGIEVHNTPGANALSVSELTMGMILSFFRFVPRGTYGLKEGLWEKKKLKGHEINGKTIGIIGFGAIGKDVAKKSRAFGLEVIAYDPFIKETDMDVKLVNDLDVLLENSDIISLHVPLTAKTKHIIGKDELAKVKDGALLVNLSRGGTVDEEALYNALLDEKLCGAALDVFEVEPPTDELRRKLLQFDNVICTPHIGATTFEGQRRVGLEMAGKLVNVAKKLKA
jgi:D-3-phosphoglycerate dehydrogenase